MDRDKSKDPRKNAKQVRSRATLENLFEAMDRVVRKSGIETFSIVEVAREAGIGRASIYDYFPTREALIAGWEERIIMREMTKVGQRVMLLLAEPPAFEESIMQLTDLVMATFQQQAVEFGYKDRFELTARSTVRTQLAENVVNLITAALEHAPDRPRIRVERIDVAARIIVFTILGLARVFALSTLSDEDKRLHRRDIAKMFSRYLLKDPVDLPDVP